MADYPTYNPHQLNSYFSNEEFVQKTIAQIKKNLNQFGYDFEAQSEKEDLLSSMVEQLYPIVSDFLENHSESFMAYLYQVDLNEHQLAKNEYGKDYIENVSFKIIRREAQKIYFQFLMANKQI